MPATTAAPPRLRQQLHFDALVQRLRQRFAKLPEPRRDPTFSRTDTLMAGLALFTLKDSSLLAFTHRALDHNLHRVFGLQALPSDTQMRCILDDMDPLQLRPAFRDICRLLQRSKLLQPFVFLHGCYLISLDGVEYFSSDKVHCDQCLTRQRNNGETQYYHQMLAAALVHPDFSEVIPLAPEPIQHQDGQSKNDCERNAARRWLKRFRREHPHLPVIITEDALSSNAPHIRDLRDAHCHFLLGVKPGDHEALFQQVDQRVRQGQGQVFQQREASTEIQRRFLFIHDVTLNEANQDVVVNFLRCVETDAQGQEHEWTWVTDLDLSADEMAQGTRGGRARWRIENETFNTLKNQGYHFEHNYGHGYKHLAVVFAMLMMLAFLIDQVQQKYNPLFRLAWDKKGSKKELWEAVRHLFSSFKVSSMQVIYEAIAYGYSRPRLESLLASALASPGSIDSS